MSDRTIAAEPKIRENLQRLPGWEFQGDHLHREYKFGDFTQAWAFMSACALHAQSLNHHPNWSNVYSRVVVDLSTHEAGGVTGLDLELAERMEAAARMFPGQDDRKP
jgi:4a-hydroxytetrahydrobiopterin dehydratase